jgi:hypothetical protein
VVGPDDSLRRGNGFNVGDAVRAIERGEIAFTQAQLLHAAAGGGADEGAS